MARLSMPGPALPAATVAMPVLAVLAGLGFFSGMDVAMKALTLHIGAYAALVLRSLAALAIALPLHLWTMRRAGGTRWPSRAVLRLHVKRATVIAGMALLFFYGLARLPMAEAIAISFIAPIVALGLAALLLGETIDRRAILAALLGLAGVAVIVSGRLGQGAMDAQAQSGLAAIIGSAFLYAWNLILQRQQAQLASPSEIALFQNAIILAWLAPFWPIWGAAAIFASAAPVHTLALLALAAGALAVAALLLLSWAYARAEAQILVPLEYSAFLWAALFGWLVFAEPLGLPLLFGALLIVAGCWIVARRKPALAAPVPPG